MRARPGAPRRSDLRHWLAGAGLDRFTGCIAAGGFGSGEQVVTGIWRDSPLGALVDVMWVRPDGHRVLLAPRHEVGAFVSGLYAFDETRVVPISGGWDGRLVHVRAGPLELRLEPARRDWRSWVFALRPRRLRQAPAWLAVENRLVPVCGPLLGGAPGVQLCGTTPAGRREWYSIDDYRPLTTGVLRLDGADQGPLRPLRGDLGVGMSEFPSQPAFVQLTTLIEPA